MALTCGNVENEHVDNVALTRLWFCS